MLTLAALGCAFAFQTTLLGSSRPWRNDRNGLLDHLALKASKSSLCQVQLCIKVVPFQKQEFWVPKSQCISLGWACLGSSGGALRGTCQSFGRHWTGPWKQLWSGSGRLWTVLMNSEDVWAVLDGSGRRWTVLDGLGSFEWQPGACSQLAESRKSCSYQWWEAYFVKSMLCIAEACSFAKVIDFQ